MKYSTIFVDWYKTMSFSIFWEHLATEDKEKSDLITNSFLGKFGGEIEPWMRGKYTAEGFCKMISGDTGLSYTYVLENLRKSCEEMKLVSEDILVFVNKLRESGSKVVLATDNMDTFSRWTVPSLKLDQDFDDILNSFSLKALKGDVDDTGSLFFKDMDTKNSVLIDDSSSTGDILKPFGIEYIQISEENDIVKSLNNLVQ